MPRIPRADSDARFQVADMPHLVGDGWTAPGRATQQLGQAIGQVGKAFAGLGAEQDQKAEQEELFNANLAKLEIENNFNMSEGPARDSYMSADTNDGRDYHEKRLMDWNSASLSIAEKYANSRFPKVRQSIQMWQARKSGQVAEHAQAFGRKLYEDKTFSRTEAALTGELGIMSTDEAAARYAEDPALFEKDLREKLATANAMINQFPFKDARADRLRKHAGDLIGSALSKAPGGVSVPTVQKMIGELIQQQSVVPPAVPGGSNPVPGPQSGLPEGPLSIEQPPLQRTVGKPRAAKIAGVVMHQTWGSDTMEGNGSWSNKTNTGANYYIAKDGKVYQWAPDEIAMGHVGKGRDSANNKRPDFTNDNTIGIEIMTRANERPNEKQVAAARALTMQLSQKYGFNPQKDVFGHGELTSPGHRRGDEAIEAVNAVRGGQQNVARETQRPVGRISDDGVQLVKQLEGKDLKAYADGRQYSIGYGTKASSPTETIDDAEAERRLTAELAKADQFVDKFVSVPLNQNQRDALTSYVYNAGPNGKAAREVFAAINAGDMNKAAEIMKADDKGGKVAGRRDKEISLFLKPDLKARAFTQVAGLGNVVPSSTGGQATQPADDGPARVFFDADRNYTKTEIDNLVKKHGPNIVIGGNPQNDGYKEMAAYAREKGAKVHAYTKGPGEPEFGYSGDGKVKFPQDHEEIRKKGYSVADWQKGGKWLASAREDMLAAKKEGAEPYSVEWDNINDKKPGEIRDLLADQTKWAKENGVTTRVVLKNLNARQWQAVNQGIEQGRIDKAIIAPFALVEEHMADGDRTAAEAEAKRQGIAQFRTENTLRYATPPDGFERPSNRIPGAAGNDNGRPPVQLAQMRPSVESHLVESLQKKLPALIQKRKGELVSYIKGVEDAAVEGRLPNERSLALLQQQVADVGDKGLAARFQNALITAQMNKNYIQAPVSAMANDLGKMDAMIAQSGVTIVPKNKGTPSADGDGLAESETEGLPPALALTVQRRDALKKLHDKAVAELKKDPTAWAIKAGLVDKLPDLTRETFSPDLLRQKAAQDDAIANHYGEEYRPTFSPGEKERLKDMINAPDGGKAKAGEGAKAVAGMIVEAYGDKSLKKFGAFTEDVPVFAALGYSVVSKLGNQTTSDIAAYLSNKAGEGAKFMARHPSREDAMQRALTVVGKGLGSLPQTEQRAVDVANAIYDTRARREGLDPKGVPNWTIWEQAYKEALGQNTDPQTKVVYGGPSSRGGVWGFGKASGTVIVPPNVRQDALPELIDALRMADIAPGGTPRPDAKALFDGSQAPPDVYAKMAADNPQFGAPDGSPGGSPAAVNTANAMRGIDASAALRALQTQGAPVNEKGEPVRLATFRNATLVNAGGEGLYWLATKDPYGPNPDWIMASNSPDGRYLLDLKKLEPVLRARVPNAYRPY